MTNEPPNTIGHLLDTPNLAEALESDRFKQFLDQMPVAIAVSEMKDADRIVYSNVAFMRVVGLDGAVIDGKDWHALDAGNDGALATAITECHDHIGLFALERAGTVVKVDAWSNLIEDDDGRGVFRLVALIEREEAGAAELAAKLSEKDVLLRELQHRVKNNLQMITALIRLEAKTVGEQMPGLDRLAGRVEALALLYQSLSDEDQDAEIDLGVYLSQIASAVMKAHATEGIHLNLQVDTWPASINVAMPTGLVVNELLTNALKHAFAGRDGGTITLQSLVEAGGCKVVVADDGIGLAPGMTWPPPGKLSALIVQSLRTNAKAQVEVVSEPGDGLRATIVFARADAEPSSRAT